MRHNWDWISAQWDNWVYPSLLSSVWPLVVFKLPGILLFCIPAIFLFFCFFLPSDLPWPVGNIQIVDMMIKWLKTIGVRTLLRVSEKLQQKVWIDEKSAGESLCVTLEFMNVQGNLGGVTTSNVRAVPNNETPTSFSEQGWWCCWQLDCLRGSGWIQSTQSGSAQYPAAASDTWAQTPHWDLPQGPPSTAPLLPLKTAEHNKIATVNNTGS